LATKIAAPVTEKGYTNAFPGVLSGFGSWDLFEENPDLLWPMSVRTYTRMARWDTRVNSILQAIGLPVRRANWWIDQNGASDEVTEFVARDLGLPIREMGDDEKPKPPTGGRFNWAKHLKTALKYQQFGHQVFEQIYRIDDDGKAHLAKLAARPSSTLAFWDVAASGDLLSVQQWPIGGALAGGGGGNQVAFIGGVPAGAPIPGDRLVVYVRDQDPGVWFGNSVLRPCYGNWVWKTQLMRIEAVAAERHGVGVPKINVSEAESEDPDRMALYGQIAQQWRGGASSGVAFPFGTDAHIMGPQGNMPAGFIRQSIEWHDKQMALGALMHFMNLDRGGSYALASALTDPWVQAVQTVADDIREVSQEGVVEKLVALNWGPDEPVPMLGCDEIGSQQDATAAALQLLQAAGIITPDGRLESFVRTQMGLPAPDPDSRPEPDQTDQVDPLANRENRAMGEPNQTTASIRVRAHTRRRSQPKTNGDTLW
jgi:hypothetical protein